MAKSDLTPSGVAETIDSPRRPAPLASNEIRLRESARKRVALVEDTGPAMSSDTRDVLRTRLRIVAALLGVGFAAFLVWRLVLSDAPSPNADGDSFVFYSHVGVTVLMVLMTAKLCGKCDLSLLKLRIAELVVIGAPALFFLLISFNQLKAASTPSAGHAHVPNVTGMWVLLIFAYALFVPNSWRRAAMVIVPLAVAPLAVMGILYWQSPHFADLCRSETFRGIFTEEILVMGLTSLTALVGVDTIGSLRREVFVAKQLGQYRLKQMLGAGGMGEVYLAEHEMMKRPCAIKVIRPEKAGDPQVLARFEREVQATAKLSHWNSIDIYDYGRTEDGTFYYVMEFLPGHNLGELVERHGPLPAARIVHLMTQVCEALTEAHDQGLVHRDIKPANIYCAYRGGIFDVAKLLDFGLAKPMSEVQDATLTQAGAITGSPLYMAPEQAIGSSQVDERSDVYSLGAVMYFMACGRPPFDYEQPLKVMVAHASEHVEPPSVLQPELSVSLERVILRCLEKRPEDRFTSVEALRAALEEIPLDSAWTNQQAADWWRDYGCPQRKALAEEVREMAAV